MFILNEILRAQKSLHKTGIFHRDVKPGNIILCIDCRVVIIDFGLAHILDFSITETTIS
ncbi:MAG TPA: hypothetical protein DCR55_15375 [Lentisphaeria bacterium]|nr:hypothetical protein [Lentisphaeria bacterium]